MRIPASGGLRGRLAKLVAIPAIGLVLAACTQQVNSNPTGDDAAPNLFGETANGIGFPHEVVTTQGIASASLYLPVFIIAVAIFVLVEGLLLFLVLRYRKRSTGDDLPVQTHGNNKLELTWTAIPMITVFVLFIVSTSVLMNDVNAKSDEHGAVVDVTAFRFGWRFEYQDPATYDPEVERYQPMPMQMMAGGGRERPPQMTLPVGEAVLIRLHSDDVIHSFYVPSFFFKRDAIPGRVNEFEITIEKPGLYGGQCAEFCGLAHGDMFFSVNAVEPAEYEAWLAEQMAQMPPADGDGPPPGDGNGSPPGDGSNPLPDGAIQLEISSVEDEPIAFTKSDLEVTAGATVAVTYINDADIPHNIAFYAGEDSDSEKLVESETITGPGASTTVTFTAPETAGAYLFRCEIHPTLMTGTLTVTG